MLPRCAHHFDGLTLSHNVFVDICMKYLTHTSTPYGFLTLATLNKPVPAQDPRKSCKMIDTKIADFEILVRTNFREVCPDFI